MNLLAIENELTGPDGEAAMQRYDQVLASLDARIANALQAGLAPDDYSAAEQLKNAVLLARKLLRLARRNAKDA
ncbi:MAG: hypothetical protein IKR81_02810 [Victivallales bacterium]|jgi:hypothetical protein|nr:hypothetical protein [Victivallales bacterium]